MKKYIFTAAVTLLITVAGYSQERLRLELGYNTAMPIGGFGDFMGKNSFRGFHGAFMYPVSSKIDVGLGISSQDYYEKLPRQLYQTKDGIISAVVSNSIQTTPIMVRGRYTFSETARLTPYAGLGAGFNFIRFGQYLGEFGESSTAFKPAVGVDAGAAFFFNKDTRSSGVRLGANFNYMPYNRNNLEALNNWGVHASVFFPLR